MEALGTIVSLLVTEGPAVVTFVAKVVPDLIALVKGQMTRDALFVSLDAAIDAHRATVRAEIHQKYASEP